MARHSRNVFAPLGVLILASLVSGTNISPLSADEAEKAAPPASKAPEENAEVPIAWVAPSQAEKKIVDALRRPVAVEFVDAPLTDVVDYLRNLVGIQVHFDKRALDDFGLGPDQWAVTVELNDTPLKTVLELMLPSRELAWTVHRGILIITTAEEAELKLSTKVYEVTDLVLCRDASGRVLADFDSLIETIAYSLDPASWDEVGGPGSIVPMTARNAHVLVISQTFCNHLKITDLLGRLRQAAAERPNDELPPVRPAAFGSMEFMGGQEVKPGSIDFGHAFGHQIQNSNP